MPQSWGWAKVHVQPTILGTPTAPCPGPMRLSEGWLQNNEDVQGVLKKFAKTRDVFGISKPKLIVVYSLEPQTCLIS